LNNILPEDWAKHGPGSYTLRYKHDQSSLEFLLKVSKLGNRTLFNAIALEDDKTASLDIPTNDFISPSFYPHEIGAAPLVHGFISSNRIADLVSQLKLKIVSRILPALRKEGYVEQSEAASTSERAAAAQPPPDNQPSARPRAENPPYGPDYPGPYPYNTHIPPENPFAIGRRDLDPIPLNPFSPPSLFPPNNRGGDGMFVGPDHPIFGDRRPGSEGGLRGPWGGDGFFATNGSASPCEVRSSGTRPIPRRSRWWSATPSWTWQHVWPR